MNYQRLRRSLGAFLIALTFGTIGGLLFWFFRVCGLIRINGYRELLQEVKTGRLIIAANHPTLLETVIIPMMFWPWALLDVRRRFVWSMPAGELFPKWLSWLYDIAHCIKVDRTNGKNHEARRLAIKVLESGSSLVVHPEGGRTDSPIRGKRKPKKPFGARRKRRIRRIISQVPNLAREANARVLPLWIDVPFKDTENGFKKALWVWISGRHTITFTVGQPFTFPERTGVPRQFWLHLDNKLLGKRILQAK